MDFWQRQEFDGDFLWCSVEHFMLVSLWLKVLLSMATTVGDQREDQTAHFKHTKTLSNKFLTRSPLAVNTLRGRILAPRSFRPLQHWGDTCAGLPCIKATCGGASRVSVMTGAGERSMRQLFTEQRHSDSVCVLMPLPTPTQQSVWRTDEATYACIVDPRLQLMSRGGGLSPLHFPPAGA